MRILFVAMSDSIHTARWVNRLQGKGWDIHLFPVDDSIIHPELQNVTVQDRIDRKPGGLNDGIRTPNGFSLLPRVERRARRFVKQRFDSWQDPARRLTRTIRKLKPDIVHSLEMQHAGYLTLESKKLLGNQYPQWIYSSWGSDLFFFANQPEHSARVREVLGECDYYIADCNRDVGLARGLGLKGKLLGVLPVTGGYDLRKMYPLKLSIPVSQRRVIALKGYHDDRWAGRALVALQALQQCADCVRDYEIEIYLAGDNVRYAAEYVARVTGLRISILPRSPVEEIAKLFGRSRIAIGLSVTDGSPSSLLEAMIMGAFPVQSDTISTAEWITHGENGLLVSAEDQNGVAGAICRALADDELVNRAAEINSRIAQERLDSCVLQPQISALYERVIAESHRKDATIN